jgi:DNA-binding transcriptional regulator YhcF (GntR family)
VTHEQQAVAARGKPSYGEVADVLTDRIRTGLLRAGERMPTQEQLAAEFGVERRTVRQALELLRDAGLITEGGKGAPARVSVPPPRDAEETPRTTAAALGPRLVEAFEAPNVRVDAICLTTETLNQALAEPLRRVQAREIATPESVRVRVLVPAHDVKLAFPRPAEGAVDDDKVHRHWQVRRDGHGRGLLLSLEALATRGIDVEVTLRTLPFTPPVKLYLLNGAEALFAYYNVHERTERIAGTDTRIFDALGSDSTLFPFESGGGRRDQAFVAQSQTWFDSLWGTLAADVGGGGGGTRAPSGPRADCRSDQQEAADTGAGRVLRLDADREQGEPQGGDEAVPQLHVLLGEEGDERHGDHSFEGEAPGSHSVVLRG